MKETESDWSKPKLGRYSELGKQLKTMTLFVPDLSGVNAFMVQVLEIGLEII
jgi:hypothetical protein